MRGETSKSEVTMFYFNALYGTNIKPCLWIKPHGNVGMSIVRLTTALKCVFENIQYMARI